MRIAHLNKTGAEHITVILEDGSEIFSTLSACTEMMLFSGKDLSSEEVSRLSELSANSLTLEKAIRLLSYRQMSGKELRRKLIEKGASQDTAEAVVQKLYDLRLLDDESYAASVIRHYSQKSYGASRLRAELSRRGISREIQEAALDSAPDNTDRLDALLSRKLKDPNDRAEVRKVSAALYRRGFSWDEIHAALNRYEINTEDY